MGFILGEACAGFVSYNPCFWTRFVPEKAAPTPLVFEDFFEAKRGLCNSYACSHLGPRIVVETLSG